MMHKKIVYIGGEVGTEKSNIATLLSYDINARVISKDSITSVFSEWFLSKENPSYSKERDPLFYENILCPLEYEQLDRFTTSQLEQEGNSQNLIVTAAFIDSFSIPEWVNTQRLKAELNGHDAYFIFLINQESQNILNTLKERSNLRDLWKISNWDEYQSALTKKINKIHSAKYAKVIYINSTQDISILRDKILEAMDKIDKNL